MTDIINAEGQATAHGIQPDLVYVDQPPPNPADTRPLSAKNHYYLKATCPCGWESRVYQVWGQANRAWHKHLRETLS